MNAINLPSPDASDLLNSWKEIAAYLDRGVRTVQRWESELGLPVRRPRAKNRSAVIAMRSEIDAWTKACLLGKPETGRQPVPIETMFPLLRQLRENRTSSHNLRMDISRARKELQLTVRALLGTLNKMVSQMPATMPAVIDLPAEACNDIAEA